VIDKDTILKVIAEEYRIPVRLLSGDIVLSPEDEETLRDYWRGIQSGMRELRREQLRQRGIPMVKVTEQEIIDAVKRGEIEAEVYKDGEIWCEQDDIDAWKMTRAGKEI
jgi:hypothetical protein